MTGIQCECGRFLAKPHAIIGGSYGELRLKDVRGDCSRCGSDVRATSEGDFAWWWSWDYWDIDEDALIDQALAADREATA